MVPIAQLEIADSPFDRSRSAVTVRRSLVGLAAFATLVDLFATQAIVPTLAQSYGVSPRTMGVAVNACTIGMAGACLIVACWSRRIERRTGIVASLALLALPTLLLAHAPTLETFALLRIAQGLCMATAFTLSLTLFGERLAARDATAASAAYITGNVASNLVGRLLSAGLADHFGLAWSFYAFAGLNIAGAGLAFLAFRHLRPHVPLRPAIEPASDRRSPRWSTAFAASCGIGFLILFGFIGVFTYVNFVLIRPPLGLGQMQLGLIYLLFLPSIVTTPLASRIASAIGVRRAIAAMLAAAAVSLGLLLVPSVWTILVGLGLVAIGTFMAQAIATGHVSRSMSLDRGTASGIYLGCYFLGGISGAAVLGWLFESHGWGACIAGVGLAFGLAAVLSRWLE